MCQEYAQQAEDKGLVLRYRDTQWAAWSDPFLVSLIVRNFISNAVRYTTTGGVLVGCRRRDKTVLIEVWDTGIGIDRDQHQNIFKEFLQLANSERDRTRGLGLGLAIVDGLCKVIEAEVSLQSVPGRGSVFRLRLPLSAEVALNPLGVDTDRLPLVRGLRVLVVDDDAAVADSMQQLLQSWGCRCHVATSLPDARALTLPDAPDVLLTDYRLQGGVTGRDVINAMRERWGPSLHCVIVTGDTAPDRLRDAHNSGAFLLHKPLSANQLLSALPVPTAREENVYGRRRRT
jgi:CheY-like chemotaxis protein/anti-sigma regulatory factor (Ser/Thr protein kinase)